MKKLYLCLFLSAILAASVCDAEFIIGGGYSAPHGSVGGGGGDCTSGTYEIGYNGDHSSGADYTCYESGVASEQATQNTADGVTSNYVSFNAADEHLRFTITGDISADIDEVGSLFFSFRNILSSGIGAIIELYYSASNIILCREAGTGTDTAIRCVYTGQAAGQSVQTGSLLSDIDYRCGYTWDETNNTHALKCVTSGSVDLSSGLDDEDAELLTEWNDSGAVDPSALSLGEDVSSIAGCSLRVWDVYIVPGYKASDPGSL